MSAVSWNVRGSHSALSITQPPMSRARVEGTFTKSEGLLLFDGVDQHDASAAEVAQLIECRDGRADRRIGIRRFADREPRLFFSLGVDRISQRSRHQLELTDQ